MPNNYTFFDSDASIITARTSITSGSAHEPLVQVSSFLTAVPTTPSGNQSVSGTVNVGNAPSIYGNISGSVASYPLGTIITSLVSTVPSSVIVGASVFGNVGISGIPNVNAAGSVVAFQGTSPWNIAGSVAATIQGTPNVNTAGSVVAFQGGTQITSVVGSIPSSLLTGVYAQRNDAIASFLGGNLTWRPIATDSAGRPVIKPFAPEESRIEGYASTVNVSVTTLVAAAGAGLRNYITDAWLANTGAATTLVTFRSGGGTSVLGYTIAPTASGSNLPGLIMPMRTLANETFDFQASTGTSVLYATVKGFIAP